MMQLLFTPNCLPVYSKIRHNFSLSGQDHCVRFSIPRFGLLSVNNADVNLAESSWSAVSSSSALWASLMLLCYKFFIVMHSSKVFCILSEFYFVRRHFENFWGASKSFWEDRWNDVYLAFGKDRFLMSMFGE